MLLCCGCNLSSEFLRLGSQLAPFWGIFGSKYAVLALKHMRATCWPPFGFIFQTIWCAQFINRAKNVNIYVVEANIFQNFSDWVFSWRPFGAFWVKHVQFWPWNICSNLLAPCCFFFQMIGYAQFINRGKNVVMLLGQSFFRIYQFGCPVSALLRAFWVKHVQFWPLTLSWCDHLGIDRSSILRRSIYV